MVNVCKRLKLAVAACAVAASAACFSPRQRISQNPVAPCEEKPLCEVAKFCAYPRQGTPASRLIEFADAASRSIRTIQAHVSVTENLFEPAGEDSCRVTTQRNTVRWILDLERRRYHLKRLDGDGTYVEGTCGTDSCVLLRRHREGKIRFGAVITRSSDQDIRDSVVEEETTVWWLGFLTLHREATMASVPNLGEKRLNLWHGDVPEVASVAKVESVGEAQLPPFGVCRVAYVAFKQPEMRDGEMWIWLAPQNGWRAVRSEIYVKSTGALLVNEVLRVNRHGDVYVPVQMRQTVYAPTPTQQEAPLSQKRVRAVIRRDIQLERVTVNEPLKESAFDFVVPMGTPVEDRLQGKNYLKQIARPVWLPWAVFAAAVFVAFYIFWRLHRLLSHRRPS